MRSSTHLRISFATPTFTLSTLPWTHRLSSDTPSPLKLPRMLNLFYKHCQGFPARQPEHGEWDRKEAPGRRRGGLIYIRDHTDAAPRAKLKLKRNSPQKNQSRGLAEEKKRHSPLVLANMGHRLRVRMQKCKNQTQTHTLQPEVWVGCGTQGTDQTPCRHR